VVSELGWADTPIFMAEPKQIGYKRRKNLSDLEAPNDLYVSGADGIPVRRWDDERPTVLGARREQRFSLRLLDKPAQYRRTCRIPT